MKNKFFYISLLMCMLAMVICACCKDPDPEPEPEPEPEPVTVDFKITTEYLEAGATSASITGSYEYDYPEKIKGIKVRAGRLVDFSDACAFEADIEGTDYSVEITGLTSGTEYRYRYEVDLGASEPFITAVKTFTTTSESPMVKTLEAQALDSTTFDISCEVLSDGGQEVTERGICWNTYGDPTLNDETLQYASGGLGQYTIRMENLPSNTVHYVRAYAKNAAGIGFGEELVFRTGGVATKPQVSTVEVTDVTYNSAQCMGNVSSDGGLDITERGVCWGLQPEPTINGNHAAAESTGLGNFTVTLGGLSPSTTYRVRCYAVNEKGIAYGEELTFTTTEGLPIVTTSAVTAITATSAKCGGEVVEGGASPVTQRGICWNTSGNPTVADSHGSGGTGTGSFTVNMTNLTPNETYYVRAYATNSQGTTYGAEVSFTAMEGLPVVQTLDVTGITATTAKAHGRVTDQGGSTVSERGVCWGTEPSPSYSGSHAHSGTGLGEYEVSMSNLSPGTKYYVRAYAKNTQGLTYGEERSFTTQATLPTVSLNGITGITARVTVSFDGGAAVTERGVCWGTSYNPTINDSHISSGTGTGSFEVELTHLAPGTTYYVRAYATNSVGTAYSNQLGLTTQANPPTVMTGEVSNITQTTAMGSGNVTNDGGATVTARGLCWSTSHNPTTSGSHANSGTGTGSFTVNMTGLTPNTTYYVRAYATNSTETTYGNEVSFTTSQSISAPTVITGEVSNITQTTALGSGNVTSNGGATVTARGLCWSTSHNPTTSGSHASSGTGTGSFTVNMTGLSPNTTYYVRAYAINSAGTSYGSEVSFTTADDVCAPTVTTGQVTEITQTSAMGGGNVTNDGGATVTARGVCWGTSHNPTINGSHASSGTGTGSYTANMTGLTPNTTYYVRAYATNSAGTSYGSEVSFTTQSIDPPAVTTGEVSNITQTTALGSGNVTATGGATVTARGICWSTSHNPTTGDSHASSGTGTGSFTVSMTGLTHNTTYYVRAYATNSAGTSYGSEVSFTTAQNTTAPTVTTGQVTDITQTTATGSGNVTASGGATVTSRGICWSTSHNPTTSNHHASSGTGTGSFTVNMTGLTSSTTYYVRAYAINSVGTSYGNEVSFTTLAAGSTIPAGAIDGLFTINASGDQVYFAQGNLQYRATTNTWRFAPNQYDCIGNDNEYISATYSGWIDLFGWGTSGYDHGALCYQPWDTCTDAGNHFAYGDATYDLYNETGQADWGYNAISNGGNITQHWRTLTGGNSGEWYYVFNTRSTASGIRYAKAKVNNVKGVILLPDDWSPSTYNLSNTNQTNASYNSNVISASQWNTLQAAGAVFLPACGYRTRLLVSYVDTYGLYWSSSHCDESRAYGLYFEDGVLRPSRGGSRDIGRSVRLVTPAE